MYLRFTITMITFPVDAGQQDDVYFYFLSSFYPSSPLPTRQCSAPTCHLSTLN